MALGKGVPSIDTSPRQSAVVPEGQLGLSFAEALAPTLTPAASDAGAVANTKHAASGGSASPNHKRKARNAVTAESLAKQQRSISVSEFFAKNRHLLGFDNKRKALLTTVKEAVDNALDACEEAGILPEIEVTIRQTAEERFLVVVRDNGPGIVKEQIPNVFGKLLYGSKFHRLKMSRGQQGIGISAAGMYGLITTGKPVRIVSRTSGKSAAHLYHLAIDTQKNRPDIIKDDKIEVEWPHGTEVSIELVANYNRKRQSVDEYLELTAIANPHARIVYHPPGAAAVVHERATQELPAETQEIKPHPYGIELGTLMKMLKETSAKKLGQFLTSEFSRVSPAVANKVCESAGVTAASWVNSVTPPAAEKLYNALQAARLRAPATNCLAPMGAEAILAGLLKGVKAEFYTASTRPPAVYRGNPFQVEVGMAYGGALGADARDHGETPNGNGKSDEPVQARLIRFANRVPLLYQQGSCTTHKSVVETKWNNYGLSQSSGALPRAPVVILVHIASVWVPFVSEGKEAVADYDEIRKEVKLALADCGRRLYTLLRRKRTKAHYTRRRDVFTRYIEEVVQAAHAMVELDEDAFRNDLVQLSESYTAQADMEFDDHGKVIRKAKPGNDLGLADTVVVPDGEAAPDPEMLFEAEPVAPAKKQPIGRKVKKKKRKKR